MIAVLVPTQAHIATWAVDNRENIDTANRIKNTFSLKDGTIARVFAIQGEVDIARLIGYDWKRIVIAYGSEAWQHECYLRVRKNLYVDPAIVEYAK